MLKYYVDDVEVSKDEFMSKLEDATNNEVSYYYDSMLNDCYEPYKIGNSEFLPSEILKSCDPTTYRCGLADESSEKLSEYQRSFKDAYTETIDSIDFETKEIYQVKDIKTGEIVAEFEDYDEADDFIENDAGDHNYEIVE